MVRDLLALTPSGIMSRMSCITAARSFNRGMRATYFALAAVAWLAGALALAGAALITLAVLYRREFASHSRTILLRIPPESKGDTVS